VLEGEITDADLLADEQVGSFDAVIALTGEDDANVLSCLYAKSAGAQETIAVVHRLSLLPLLAEVGIDVALSPRTATANGVMRFVRGGVAAVATFLQGEAEVLELEVVPRSPADGAILAELRLPKNVLVGAIVRDGKAQIGRGRSQLRARDHVIVFAMPSSVREAKRIFG
jgi:trk system potassium uptake protein TrkA